jgi:CubicO group peptidase (beta-lactamase class C family)
VLVLQGGLIAAEAYAAEWGPDRAAPIASAAKSMVAVLAGIAIDRGLIEGVEQSAADFIPEWRGTPKETITIRHLLTMTSGLGSTGLAARDVTGDQAAINAGARVEHPPGEVWSYNTPVYHLLFHVVARAAGEPFEDFARRVLIGPLEMEHFSWVTGVGRGRAGEVTNYYTAACSSRDLARFGLLALRGGRWRDRQLVDPEFLREATTPSQELNPGYGYLWWLNARPSTGLGNSNPGLVFPGSPRDTFAAMGGGGQVVMVVPSLDLVVVRQGARPREDRLTSTLLAAVVAALDDRLTEGG